MKAMTAGQQSVSQADAPEGSGAWSGDDGWVGVAAAGLAATRPSDFLPPAQVHELLVSSPESRQVPDFGGSRVPSDLFGETEFVPMTLGSHAGVYDAPDRTDPGASDGHDVLRAARGIIWVTVFAVPFWSGMLLLLHWL